MKILNESNFADNYAFVIIKNCTITACTYGKRDCRNYWRYASLAVYRAAIKLGFTCFMIID